MAKLLEATCVSGVVKVGSLAVAGAEVFSEGVAQSSGILFLDEDGKYYFAKTSEDLKTALNTLSTALTQIATALTAIDAKPTGGVASAVTPVAAASVAAITSAQASIATLKETLK